MSADIASLDTPEADIPASQETDEINHHHSPETGENMGNYSALPSLNAIRCAAEELESTHTPQSSAFTVLSETPSQYSEYPEEIGHETKETKPHTSAFSAPDSLSSVLIPGSSSLLSNTNCGVLPPSSSLLQSENDSHELSGSRTSMEESSSGNSVHSPNQSTTSAYKTPITQAQRQKEYRKRKREEREMEKQRVLELEEELTKVKRQREQLLEERHRNDFWKILGENLRLLLQELPPVSPFRADLINLLGRGLKCKDLSKNLNIPESTVRSALNKTNIQLTKVKYPLKVTRNRKSKKESEPNSPTDSPPGHSLDAGMPSTHFISGPIGGGSPLTTQIGSSSSSILGSPLGGNIISSSLVPTMAATLSSSSMSYLTSNLSHGGLSLSINPLSVLSANGNELSPLSSSTNTTSTSSNSLLGSISSFSSGNGSQSSTNSTVGGGSGIAGTNSSTVGVGGSGGSPNGLHHHHHHSHTQIQHHQHPHTHHHHHHQPHSPISHSHLQLLQHHHHHQLSQHSRNLGDRDSDDNRLSPIEGAR